MARRRQDPHLPRSSPAREDPPPRLEEKEPPHQDPPQHFLRRQRLVQQRRRRHRHRRRRRGNRNPKTLTGEAGDRDHHPRSGHRVPARLSVFKKLISCAVEGKVKENFAIVKKSENPLEDFKRSMMDMIVEKQMFDKKDLE
ncbi:hypothetical protein SASPL_112720 [Salvia splendens]|uniref:Transcription repressor n=1 Tax=Salvia splendens TaxID=180675 RepID=A0A8X8Y9L2_SALSN|nr:hypothetical protein SASPL_112720 [Salvia splendens]